MTDFYSWRTFLARRTFNLKHNGGGCGVSFGDSFILISGFIDYNANSTGHQYVSRYNMQNSIGNLWILQIFRYNVSGFVEELPPLPDTRLFHACAAVKQVGPDWNNVSLPSHRWTDGWQPSKTIVIDGWLSEKPLKNHQWQYRVIKSNCDKWFFSGEPKK